MTATTSAADRLAIAARRLALALAHLSRTQSATEKRLASVLRTTQTQQSRRPLLADQLAWIPSLNPVLASWRNGVVRCALALALPLRPLFPTRLPSSIPQPFLDPSHAI